MFITQYATDGLYQGLNAKKENRLLTLSQSGCFPSGNYDEGLKMGAITLKILETFKRSGPFVGTFFVVLLLYGSSLTSL